MTKSMIAPLLEKYTLYDKTKDIEDVPRKVNKSCDDKDAYDVEIKPPCPIHNVNSFSIQVKPHKISTI